MAGWRVMDRIRGHRFWSEGFIAGVLICIAVCMNLSTSSFAQEGFLSIDCGYTGPDYTDDLNLPWVSDEKYTSTGNNTEQTIVYSEQTTGYSMQPLQWFRYFPLPRSKFCYELPTTPDVSYLIRANFYLNGSEFNKSRPFEFSLFINATNWFTITSGDYPPSGFFVSQEAIFYSPWNLTYLCLQPVVGLPFISSLELRPLNATMYSYNGSQRQYLALLNRLNMASNTTPAVRFPDDHYDRIWWPPAESYADFFPIISAPTPPDNITTAEVYFVPPTVMQDGWLMAGPSVYNYPSLNFGLPTSDDQTYMTPGEYALTVLYFEYLNLSDSTTYSVDFDIDYTQGQASFSHQASMQATPNFILSSNSVTLQFDSLNLTQGPTLNAIEVYGQYNFNFSQTYPADGDAVTALKMSLSLENWQGDPCTPVPHDWLSCSLSSFGNIQPIQQPCGSNITSVKECKVQQGSYFLNSKYTVTALNISSLGTNDLSLFTNASANSSDIWLPDLTEMRLTSSGIDYKTFVLLIEHFLIYLYSFTDLDLSNNIIDSIPPASVWAAGWADMQYLTSLNLSHNVLSGTLNSFQDLPFVDTLQELDLSYNAISNFPGNWTNTTNSLVVLDLSYNRLQGEMSSLDELIKKNAGSLKYLNLSHNTQLSGPFSGSLYFSGLPNLTIANFDQIAIQGTLNLSAWYNRLQMVASQNSSILVDTLPLFSFRNNSISDISPSAQAFESTISILTKNQTFFQKGILLGGNPYCNSVKSYTQQFFCRSSINDTVTQHHKGNKNILIISITGGIAAFILFLIIVATLWKLWKQVRDLRRIQQALANRKVQPPFYQYSDLKFATRDFHRDYKLGHGSFGVVYKGVLVDKTTLAVKKLFNSQSVQVLDDFLNEVVLITGIKHKNLVQLKGCCIKDKQRMLVYEYVENGNLAEALFRAKKHGGLSWEQCFDICVGVARGLSYLHEELQPSIIHRDIKPENILLDKNFRPKIADFGLARHFSEETNQAHFTQVAGTLGYFAPEYASEGQLSNKADVYSYGVLLLEVVSGRKCIDHSKPTEAIYLKDWVRKMHKTGMLFDILKPELRGKCDEAQVIRAINIGLLCVQHHPEKRPSMSQVVTMFLGSAEVEVFLDEADDIHFDFKGLLLTIDHDIENFTLQSIVEEEDSSSSLHLIDLASESSSSYSNNSSRQNERHLVELSTIKGR